MLEKLLNVIQVGGTFEVQELADKLRTTPDLVRMMLEQLERMGKVRANPACESGCAQCGLKNKCHVGEKDSPGVNSWVMIELSH